MKYGMVTNHDVSVRNGSVYILKDLDEKYYLVVEGNCHMIRKDAITLIQKVEYEIIRNVQNELLEKKDLFSAETKEYLEEIYGIKE